MKNISAINPRKTTPFLIPPMIAVLLGFGGPASAQEAVGDGDFKETLHPVANTGGARVAGVQMTGQFADGELHTALPNGWGEFCVRTGTSDGLYDGESSYVFPEKQDDGSAEEADAKKEPIGTVRVPYLEKSVHKNKLTSLDPHGIAVRVTKGPCDKDAESPGLAIAMWQDAVPANEVLILVNSFGAQRLVAIPKQDGTDLDPAECELIDAQISVAYDRVCAIGFDANGGSIEVKLLPFKNKKRGRAETVIVELNSK